MLLAGAEHLLIGAAAHALAAPVAFAVVPINLAPNDSFGHRERDRHDIRRRGRAGCMPGVSAAELGPVIDHTGKGGEGPPGDLRLPVGGQGEGDVDPEVIADAKRLHARLAAPFEVGSACHQMPGGMPNRCR